jgi:hypothetical protein
MWIKLNALLSSSFEENQFIKWLPDVSLFRNCCSLMTGKCSVQWTSRAWHQLCWNIYLPPKIIIKFLIGWKTNTKIIKPFSTLILLYRSSDQWLNGPLCLIPWRLLNQEIRNFSRRTSIVTGNSNKHSVPTT